MRTFQPSFPWFACASSEKFGTTKWVLQAPRWLLRLLQSFEWVAKHDRKCQILMKMQRLWRQGIHWRPLAFVWSICGIGQRPGTKNIKKLGALNAIITSQHLKTGSCWFGNERGQAFIIRSSFTSWSFNFGVSSGKYYQFSCLPRKPSRSPIFDVMSWRYIDAAPTKLLIWLRTFEICIL